MYQVPWNPRLGAKISKYLRARGHLHSYPGFSHVARGLQNHRFYDPHRGMLQCTENILFTIL